MCAVRRSVERRSEERTERVSGASAVVARIWNLPPDEVVVVETRERVALIGLELDIQSVLEVKGKQKDCNYSRMGSFDYDISDTLFAVV